MHNENELVPIRSLPGHKAVVANWLFQIMEEKDFVNPIANKKEACSDWVQDWHTRRIEEANSNDKKYACVPEFNFKSTASIDVFIILLD